MATWCALTTGWSRWCHVFAPKCAPGGPFGPPALRLGRFSRPWLSSLTVAVAPLVAGPAHPISEGTVTVDSATSGRKAEPSWALKRCPRGFPLAAEPRIARRRFRVLSVAAPGCVRRPHSLNWPVTRLLSMFSRKSSALLGPRIMRILLCVNHLWASGYSDYSRALLANNTLTINVFP